MSTRVDASPLVRKVLQVPESQLRASSQFNALRNLDDVEPAEILASISSNASVAPQRALNLFSLLLTEKRTKWPPLDVVRCHVLLVKELPEDVKTGQSGEATRLVENTERLVHGYYRSMADFIPANANIALRSSTDDAISYSALHEFVETFQLPISASGPRKPVVTVALPNGPLLAATLLATTTYYTAAPINPATGAEQFYADVQQSRSRCILTTPSYYEKLKMHSQWRREEMDVFFVDLDQDKQIHVTDVADQAIEVTDAHRCEPNRPRDIGLILFTSGTSGTKKVVPLTVHSIVCGAALVVSSWALTRRDVCLNMMPLYHV